MSTQPSIWHAAPTFPHVAFLLALSGGSLIDLRARLLRGELGTHTRFLVATHKHTLSPRLSCQCARSIPCSFVHLHSCRASGLLFHFHTHATLGSFVVFIRHTLFLACCQLHTQMHNPTDCTPHPRPAAATFAHSLTSKDNSTRQQFPLNTSLTIHALSPVFYT